MAQAPLKAHANLPKGIKRDDRNMIDVIDGTRTQELVIAFCGPLGSGVSWIVEEAEKLFKEFKYDPKPLKVSDIIKDKAGLRPQLADADKAESIELLQTGGNELRKKELDILAQHAVRKIAVKRWDEKVDVTKRPEPEDRRYVTLIDSLKHPAEVALLKAVYGEMFYLVGVLCPETVRKNRLQREKGIPEDKVAYLAKRDKSEEIGHGQQLLKVMEYADFFVRNMEDPAAVVSSLKRFIRLILGANNITPTMDEYAMFTAFGASLLSGCMSRQVGAAIMKDGEIVATGRNDVPKYKGGLYTCDDEKDLRCMFVQGKKCRSNIHKDNIFDDIEGILKKAGVMDPAGTCRAIKKGTDIKNLIEYSRSIHAEMDAITSAARLGLTSLKDSTLYCTTFPCHHCARHIVSSGIKKVYYIEPYEKSLAYDLHSDSIDLGLDEPRDEASKLQIIPFEGVAPRKFNQLFECQDRKGDDGTLKDVDPKTSSPLIQKFRANYTEFESKVLQHLDELDG